MYFSTSKWLYLGSNFGQKDSQAPEVVRAAGDNSGTTSDERYIIIIIIVIMSWLVLVLAPRVSV